MKRILVATALALGAISLSAAPIDAAAVQKYAKKLIPVCPGSTITIERINETGPAGFDVYLASNSSSDARCGNRNKVLVSPETEQVILGQIITLPPGSSLLERLTEKGSELLKEPVSASVDRLPLPDGLRAFTITRQTGDGLFAYHGYIDASQNFLIIGLRGNLRVDPGKTLLDAILSPYAVHRGNRNARTQIIEMSDLQCPTCGLAHTTLEPVIAKNLAKIDYVRVDLPLFQHHEWSLRAALGARALQRVAPAYYWKYIDFVFRNQETIGKADFDKVFHDFSEDNEIDWRVVEKYYKSDAEKRALLDQVSRAFDVGIVSTPTFIINGQQIGFAEEGKYMMDAVKKAATGGK